MSKLKIEVTKFSVVGAINFGLTFMVFSSMLEILKLHYLLSLLCAWVIGLVFSYVMNYVWVFKREQKIKFERRFLKFLSASLLSITLNMLCLHYIVEHSNFYPFYVQMALIPFIMTFNFATTKFWSLSQ